tara:strand:+ start:26 stop:481 length:456 start_codon:yes stop_codon:yes gene_type:complete
MPNMEDIRNIVLKDAHVVKGPGKLLYFDVSDAKALLGAGGKFVLGVSAGNSSRDAEQVLEVAGATVGYYPLGGVLMVQATAGQTLIPGGLLYGGANGLATNVAGSDKKIGIYIGEALETSALALNGVGDASATEGQMIPVATHSAEAGANA